MSGGKDPIKGTLKQDYLPILEKGTSATEEELEHYRKKLRRYFLHGNKTTDGLQVNVTPVTLAPFLRAENPEMEFPALYDLDTHIVTSLWQELQDKFYAIFDTEKADMLTENIPRIISLMQEKINKKNSILQYDLQIKEVIKVLQKLDTNSVESESSEKEWEQVETQLLAKKATLIGFSSYTAFQILNFQLKKRNELNLEFLTKLKKCISGLKDILLLQGDETDQSKSHFDFAGELISFDKITDMALPKAGSGMPVTRLERLRNCLHILSQAYKSYSGNCITIFVSPKLAKEFELEKTLKEGRLKTTSERSCLHAKNYFNREIRKYVQVIAALRMAELEINNNYEEDIHTLYFEGFNLAYLSTDDIKYFRSLIVVEENLQLTKQPKDFLSLLSSGDFVKVLAVNRLDKIYATIRRESEEETFLELAALAIFRRNACVFQGGAHNPAWLNEAFLKGLDAPSPVLWNILFRKSRPKRKNADCLELRTAVESRVFPHLVYDIRSGDDFGSHFDISGNPQPEQPFPSFDQEIKSSSGKQTLQYSLTMADFFALKPENMKMLEILPIQYSNEDLVPLEEYLIEPQDSVAGKIPFTWMVDEQNILKQVAIPISWLRHCRTRLDYWRFLQELGGLSSYRLRRAIGDAKSEWEAVKKAEVEDLKAQLHTEFDRTRTDDIGKAIKKMLNALLDPDKELTVITGKEGTTVPSKEVNKITDEPEIVKEKEDTKTTIPSEAWVESDQCTSCNDCIEALPAVFKYNSDKQAYVHNPKGGSYAKIVSSAEKCPARCIHPGLPHNPGEPGLEKLIKRAEKFN